MTNYDFLVIGGGIFGITAAIELAKREHRVGLLNPDSIPHHLAASTDVSKIVRMEYGSDQAYFRMAEICLTRWRAWNELFNEKLFHETGFLMLCKNGLESGRQEYERHSWEALLAAGHTPERLGTRDIAERFPAVNTAVYSDAIFNPKGGYIESGRAVERLAGYARSLGVAIHEGQTAAGFVVEKNRLKAVKTREGNTYHCGHAVVAAGAHTPYLLPELQPYMRPTGHPVFWLKPKEPRYFSAPCLPVFTADISNSGWYGFPVSPRHGIVKLGLHAGGQVIHPDNDDRVVSDREVGEMRAFLKNTFPSLADAPLVYTRKCLYTDTLDGHYWIDRHPEIEGLSVSTGGSGHAFKMGPLLGEMAADMAEGKQHPFSGRFGWRHLEAGTVGREEARHLGE